MGHSELGAERPYRIIVTGLNGSGKSHLARRLAHVRPDLPLHSYDSLRLTQGWQKRPDGAIVAALSTVVDESAWIMEGGPSLLDHAQERCQFVIWLDPPMPLRAWRLLVRPWRNLGRTRAELPEGNVDWPLSQYRFAWRSLRRTGQMRAGLTARLGTFPEDCLRLCRTQSQIDAVLTEMSRL